MTQVLSRIGVALVVVLVAVWPARGQEAKTHPCAVLVGIDQYADSQILPRPHAEADVKAFYDLVTDKDRLGLGKDQVRLLLGAKDAKRPSDVATHENILEALRWAASSAGKDDLVIVALMLQGAPNGDRTCYFATDSTFKDRAKNAVASSEVQAALGKLKSQKFCAFLDVNFKGFKIDKGKAPDANLQNFYQEFLSGGKEDQGPPPGRILFLANSGLRPSLETENHGLFAKVVLDALKGAADKEGYEPDGVVTVDELADYVHKVLPAESRRVGKTREEKQMRYIVLGGRGSHFELTRNPAVTAAIQKRLEAFKKFVAEQKTIEKNIADEGVKLLSRMPKLEAYRSLRKDYQQLADGKLKIDEFLKDRTRILGEMKINRDYAAAFAAKVIQATQLILKEYVKKTNQGELVTTAIKGLYTRIDEKIPHEVQERLDAAKKLSEEDLTKLLTDVRERLGKREDLANHKDLDIALQRMMSPLDPYTTYIDPETVTQFKRETAGNFVGIGIQIRVDTATDRLMVISPIKGSPAYKAGIMAGDIITTVTKTVDEKGNPLPKPEVIPTKGLPINDAVKRIVGKPGTPVKLTIDRPGVDYPMEFEIKRGLVEVETVLGVKRNVDDDSWNYVLDPKNQICYVRLTSFARFTEKDLAKALEAMLKKQGGIKGLILDLRFNPGGLLTSAVNISDMFIDDGLIVTIRPRAGDETPYYGDHEGSLLDFPMVCLVNGHSASGSEIVSACLQDHGRAVVMGERSYGKGSVQNIQPFEEGELKLTTATFWRPSGKNLYKAMTKGRDDEDWGVVPDKGYVSKLTPKQRDQLEEHMRQQEIIPRRDRPSEDAAKPFKDTQLEMALKYLREQVKLASKAPAKKAG